MTEPTGQPLASARRPRRTVTATIEDVVDAALAIARTDGLDGVAVRSVASRLDISPMSMYRFIDSKDDLLDEIVVRVLNLMEVPPGGAGSWVDRVVAVMSAWRSLLLEHPVVIQILVMRRIPPQSEGLVRLEEHVLAALEEAQIVGDEAVAAFWQIFALAFGHVVFERPREAIGQAQQRDAGAVMADVAAARKMPRVTALADRLTHLPARRDFASSLRTLLAGIEATAVRPDGRPSAHPASSPAGESTALAQPT